MIEIHGAISPFFWIIVKNWGGVSFSSFLWQLTVEFCVYFRFCPEIFIGEEGHRIRTCHGFKRVVGNELHQWVGGRVGDVLAPVEAFHLSKMFQGVIRHEQRFNVDRVPAVVELCAQAGAEVPPEDWLLQEGGGGGGGGGAAANGEQMRRVAERTVEAWEELRAGVQRLLLVYPAKVCKHCGEVHVGPSGHRARLCGVFRFERWRGGHFWKRAEVDDLVPPRLVWRRRPYDPEVLVDAGRGFYGHAPAVIELCSQAGAAVPKKYFSLMKLRGLSEPAHPGGAAGSSSSQANRNEPAKMEGRQKVNDPHP